MAPKRKTSAGDESTAKMQKKVMSLNYKVDLPNQLSRGQSVASVGRHDGVNEPTICDTEEREGDARKCCGEHCTEHQSGHSCRGYPHIKEGKCTQCMD